LQWPQYTEEAYEGHSYCNVPFHLAEEALAGVVNALAAQTVSIFEIRVFGAFDKKHSKASSGEEP
jgi:hypothetical protein